ncbi:hypothetical protein BH23ACT11_BH23ACT11_14090 [soil metagenome]
MGSGTGRRRDLSMSMGMANLYVLIISGPVTALLALIYAAFWNADSLFVLDSQAAWLVALGLVVVGVLVHEALHGLSAAYFSGKPLETIKFGFQLKTLTPYAHIREPILARAYRLGTAAPGVVLGLVPSVIGLISGSGSAMLFGLFFTFAAGGDALILWLIRGVRGDTLVEDHPTNAGCYVYEPGSKGT